MSEALTLAKRLAYISPHEAQESSGSGPWPQGRESSHEEDVSAAASNPCSLGSQCSLDQERRERVTRIRRPYMTRSTFQQGYVFSRTTRHGKVHVIRYRVRSADGKWRHKAE